MKNFNFAQTHFAIVVVGYAVDLPLFVFSMKEQARPVVNKTNSQRFVITLYHWCRIVRLQLV